MPRAKRVVPQFHQQNKTSSVENNIILAVGFRGACFSLRGLKLARPKPRKLKHAPLKTDSLLPWVRGGGRVPARDRRLIPGHAFNFQEHLRRFVFQRIPHLFVILLGVLP